MSFSPFLYLVYLWFTRSCLNQLTAEVIQRFRRATAQAVTRYCSRFPCITINSTNHSQRYCDTNLCLISECLFIMQYQSVILATNAVLYSPLDLLAKPVTLLNLVPSHFSLYTILTSTHWNHKPLLLQFKILILCANAYGKVVTSASGVQCQYSKKRQ